MLPTTIKINPEYIPHLKNMSRTQIFYGGSGSGKSVFLAQRCVIDVLAGGRNYLVCRQVARTVRRSVFNEIVKVIYDANLGKYFVINKSESIITCVNGYQIMFAGLDDVEKIKSITPSKGVITDIWVEEATETERNTYKNLLKRQRGGDESIPKRIIFSFNPILKIHWIYEEFFVPIGWEDGQSTYMAPGLSITKTWFIHNAFLTKHDVADLLAEKDSYYLDVYAYGNWGVLGNVIFKNWRSEDLTPMRSQFVIHRFGLDFGFSADPAAVVCTHYDKKTKTIYVWDELYEKGLTNNYLATHVKRMTPKYAQIICDSAEPKSIAELRTYKVNAIGAVKGKDSVLHGIQWLQQQTIIIDNKCINMRNELQQYKWREDKDGNAMMEPLDKNNHLLDALRYAYERESTGGIRITVDAGVSNYTRSNKDE